MRGVRGDDSKCCFGMQIFGIHLAASVGVTEAEFLHVGSVLAGYLDNDSDSNVPGHLNSGASRTPTASVPELGPRLATFALGRGLPSQILHRDWAHPSNSLARPCRICIGAWLNPACGRYHDRPSLPSASLRAQADNAGVAYTIRRQMAVILVTRDRPELERLLLQAPYALSPASAAPAIGRVR